MAEHAAEETDALFVVHGATVLYDDDGRVLDVIDAGSHRRDYLALVKAQGKPLPRIIEGGHAGYSAG